MIDAALEFLKWWLSAAWSLFGVQMPGFNFSIGTFLVGGLIISVTVTVLDIVFGFGGSAVAEYRSGPSGKARNVSERRKHDEY